MFLVPILKKVESTRNIQLLRNYIVYVMKYRLLKGAVNKITLQSRMTISLKAINTSPPLLSYSELFFFPQETRYTAGISQA